MKWLHFIPLLFFYNINFVFSQDESQKSENYSYPNNDRVGYYIFLILTLVFVHLNILGKTFKLIFKMISYLYFLIHNTKFIYLPSGIFYIFYWTFTYWKRSGSLLMVLKVPFYIGCSDALISLSEIPESVIKLHILSDS